MKDFIICFYQIIFEFLNKRKFRFLIYVTRKGETKNTCIILTRIIGRKFLEKEVRIKDDTEMTVLIVFTWLNTVVYGGFFEIF
jgi:hypothetical protein